VRCQPLQLVLDVHPLIQGASGVLGTAVWDAFARAPGADNTVIGLANSRSGGERNHRQLNLLDTDAVSTFFREAKPNCK
jgi:nucleoside-diphosphate-sugar epimerase